MQRKLDAVTRVACELAQKLGEAQRAAESGLVWTPPSFTEETVRWVREHRAFDRSRGGH